MNEIRGGLPRCQGQAIPRGAMQGPVMHLKEGGASEGTPLGVWARPMPSSWAGAWLRKKNRHRLPTCNFIVHANANAAFTFLGSLGVAWPLPQSFQCLQALRDVGKKITDVMGRNPYLGPYQGFFLTFFT